MNHIFGATPWVPSNPSGDGRFEPWLDTLDTISTHTRHSLDTVDTVDTGVNRHPLDTPSTLPTLVSTSVDSRYALMLSTVSTVSEPSTLRHPRHPRHSVDTVDIVDTSTHQGSNTGPAVPGYRCSGPRTQVQRSQDTGPAVPGHRLSLHCCLPEYFCIARFNLCVILDNTLSQICENVQGEGDWALMYNMV